MVSIGLVGSYFFLGLGLRFCKIVFLGYYLEFRVEIFGGRWVYKLKIFKFVWESNIIKGR